MGLSELTVRHVVTCILVFFSAGVSSRDAHENTYKPPEKCLFPRYHISLCSLKAANCRFGYRREARISLTHKLVYGKKGGIKCSITNKAEVLTYEEAADTMEFPYNATKVPTEIHYRMVHNQKKK